MSVVVRTSQCYPLSARQWAITAALGFAWVEKPQEPDHEHCPGGHHIPGVIGGWHCPCPCHRQGEP